MKHMILALAAVTAIAGSLAATDASAQNRNNQNRYDQRQNWDRQEDRWDRREDRWDRREDRWDRREDRRDRRDDNRRWNNNNNGRWNDNRWDNRRYNGYYLGNQWYYGPPQTAYYNRYDYRPGYQSWRRGQRLPSYYNSYVVYDYPRYRLRTPPRGYHWVQSGNDFLLAAIATGLILEVFSNGY